jgi:hypothetical protein
VGVGLVMYVFPLCGVVEALGLRVVVGFLWVSSWCSFWVFVRCFVLGLWLGSYVYFLCT